MSSGFERSTAGRDYVPASLGWSSTRRHFDRLSWRACAFGMSAASSASAARARSRLINERRRRDGYASRRVHEAVRHVQSAAWRIAACRIVTPDARQASSPMETERPI